MNEVNKLIWETVIDNPTTCRRLLEELRKRGVKFVDSLDGLTADELKIVAQRIMDTLETREAH